MAGAGLVLCLTLAALIGHHILQLLVGDEGLLHGTAELILIHNFIFDEESGHEVQLIHIRGEDLLGLLIGFVHDALYLRVNGGCGSIGIVLGMVEVTSQEHLVVAGSAAVLDRSQQFRHTVLGHHAAGDLGGTLDIVGRTGVDISDERFRHTAGEQYRDLVGHLSTGGMGVVILGHGQSESGGTAAGNNGDMMNGTVLLQLISHDGMTCLVVGGDPFILFGNHAGTLLGAHDDLQHRLLDIVHTDELLALAGGEKRGLIQKVGQIRTGEAHRRAGNDLQADILLEGLVLAVNAEDLLASLYIRIAYGDLPIKATGTKQCRIQNVGAVGGRHNDDAVVGAEAIHFHQKLVQGLLAFIVTAAQTGTSLAAYRVDLIDEDDSGRGFFRILKQIAHTGCAHAHVHLHEVRAGNGEERHAGFTCHGLGQEGLTGSGRAYEKHTVGDLSTQFGKVGRIAKELNQLLQFCLFLIGAGHVLEEHLRHIRRIGAHFGTSKGIGTGSATAHRLIGGKDPHSDQQNNNNNGRQEGYPDRNTLRRRDIVLFNDAPLQLVSDGITQHVPEQSQIPQLVYHGRRGFRSVFQNDADIHLQFVVLLHHEGFDSLPLKHLDNVTERNIICGEGLPQRCGGDDDHTDHHYIENCVFQVALHELLRTDSPRFTSPRRQA